MSERQNKISVFLNDLRRSFRPEVENLGKRSKAYISIFAIFLCTFFILKKIHTDNLWQKEDKVISWDVNNYYAFLPAAFIENDLTFSYVAGDYKYKDNVWPRKAHNGALVIKTSMGMSILYAPFFLTAHAYCKITGREALGYSPPYKLMLLYSCLFYLLIGLLCLRKTLLRYFSDLVTGLSIVGIVMGTELFFYSTSTATMAHAYDFALISVVLYLTHRWHDKQSVGTTILTGLVMGLIVLVRPVNIIILLVFIFYNVTSLSDIKKKFVFFLDKKYLVLLMALCSFAVWIPQLIYWKVITGDWFYYSYKDEGFYFSDPKFYHGLFGYRKGWFLYTPMMLVASLSLPLIFFNSLRKMGFAIVLFYALNMYIIVSWWCWWWGGCYGNRAFVDSYAIMALGIASFLSAGFRIRSVLAKIGTVALFGLLIFHSQFQTEQYENGAIHYDSMTKEAYWESFMRSKPTGEYWKLLKSPDYTGAKANQEKF